MPLSVLVHSAALSGVRGRALSIRVDVPLSSPRPPRHHEDVIVRQALSRLGVPHVPFAVEITPDPSRSFDSANLATALALLSAYDKVPPSTLANVLVLGHLTMDAAIQPVRGILPILMSVRKGDQPLTVLIPRANLREAQLMAGTILLLADSLSEAITQLLQTTRPLPTPTPLITVPDAQRDPCLDALEIAPYVRRALELAASGHHHILLTGPRGSSTTWLARRLHCLIPPPTPSEALTITAHHSAAGLALPPSPLITQRPFRAPHHTVSTAAMTGVGQIAHRPGELTLAHYGVLLLDELTEFNTHVLESIAYHVMRKAVTAPQPNCEMLTMPAEPLVVATMTNCPCGSLGHPDARCRCTPKQIAHHHARIPARCQNLFDLIVPVIPHATVIDDSRPGDTWAIRLQRIVQARTRRASRPSAHQISTRLTDAAVDLLRAALTVGTLESTTEARVVDVASTIADLAGADLISDHDIEQALAYRLPAQNNAHHERPQ
jgi:magnesium chelatase family protein